MSARLSPIERLNASTLEAEALAFWLGDSKHFGFCEAHAGRGFRVTDSRGQMMDGFPDCLMLLPGWVGLGKRPDLVVAIEIKINNDTLSLDQRDVLDRFERAGALVLVVRYGRLRPGEVDQNEAVRLILEALSA